MELVLLLSVLCLLLGTLVVLSELRRRATKKTVENKFNEWKSVLEGRYQAISEVKGQHTEQIDRERKAYQELTQTWKTQIGSINDSLTNLDKQAISTVREMASTLKPIVSIFRSPQIAGIEFGEAELELLLKTHLGEGLYVRKPRLLAVGQDTVDFAVTLPGECIIPIDSKFPSSSYKAWVEAESDEQAKAAWRIFRNEMLEQLEAVAKYIKPDAGTTDYALLFVPSDVIYQQAFLTTRVYDQDNPISKRSMELQVFGCSTQTLMPYFGLIRLGLRNFKISEDVKGLRRQIEQLDVVFRAFREDWETVRGHVDRLSKHVEKLSAVRGSVDRLEKVVAQLTGTHVSSGSESLPDTSELLSSERSSA